MADIQKSKRDKGREEKRKRYGVFAGGPAGFDPSWHYFALFRLLQLSESYWLAHQEQVSGLRPETPPLEFDKVRYTYGLFGSVWDIPFWVWWRERAHMHFGSAARVELLGHLPSDRAGPEPFDRSDVEAHFSRVHAVNRLVISLPLTGTRTSVLKQIEAILRENEVHWSGQPAPAAYKVIKDKTQRATLNAAIRTVQARAYFTDAKTLRFVGEHSKIVPQEWDEIDEIALSSIASRHIRRAFLWAENAARGRFLSEQKPPQKKDWRKFDFGGGLRTRLETYVRISAEALDAIPDEEQTSEHRYAGRNRTIVW